MKRGVVPAAVLLATILLVVGVSAQQNNIPPPDPNCTPLGRAHLDGQHYPTSIEPEFSVWCYQQPAAMPATRASGVNDWVDTFDNDAPSRAPWMSRAFARMLARYVGRSALRLAI